MPARPTRAPTPSAPTTRRTLKSTQSGNSFSATVTNFRNPFLVGYGVGARTTLLGFYGKVDVAWGQEDYVTKGPKFYFTLGYDF